MPLRRLDDVAGAYLASHDRVFLKIDTQGYEAEVLAGAARLLERLAGIQLEMALVPLYEGERPFRAMLDELAALGFEPWLFLPGYFERKLARQLQLDGVFMRAVATPRRRLIGRRIRFPLSAFKRPSARTAARTAPSHLLP